MDFHNALEELIENSDIESTNEGTPSPSGQFSVLINNYKCKKGWNISRAIIKDTNGNELLKIDRNYSSFYHGWIVYKGKEYLLCSQNYHGGMTVVEPESKKIYNYNPPETEKYTPYFCWSGPWILSPDSKTLAVCGCYWSGPYNWFFYDVSEDITNLPLKSLLIIDRNGEECCVEDCNYDNLKYNMQLELEYENKYGKNWEDNNDILEESILKEKPIELDAKWNSDGTFSTTGAYREGDKIIYNNYKR